MRTRGASQDDEKSATTDDSPRHRWPPTPESHKLGFAAAALQRPCEDFADLDFLVIFLRTLYYLLSIDILVVQRKPTRAIVRPA